MPDDKPARAYVGKYLFFYTSILPKTPYYIDLNCAYVTGAKADRQMYVKAATQQDVMDKTFTRCGEHIAACFDTLAQAEAFRARLIEHKAQADKAESELRAYAQTLLEQTPAPRPR